ncbi:hypothetical protein GCM10027048_27930 [Hymenobacter coalescens]
MTEDQKAKVAVIWAATGNSKGHPGQRRLHIDNITQEEEELILAFLQSLQNGRAQALQS